MKNLNLIELVEKMLFFLNLGLNKEYNKIKKTLKEKYPDTMVLSTINYLNGEYTQSQEKVYKELHKGL
jgi:hypothetical protein